MTELQPYLREAQGVDGRLLVEPELGCVDQDLSWPHCAPASAVRETNGDLVALPRIGQSKGESIEFRRERPVVVPGHGVTGTPRFVKSVRAFSGVRTHCAIFQVGQDLLSAADP